MDIKELQEIVEEQNKKIELLNEKFNELEKKFKNTPVRKTKKESAKNIDFEEAFKNCQEANKSESFNFPCMRIFKSGQQKGKCCGITAVLVENEDNEQVKINGKIEEEFFHSLRCTSCKSKGGANSESKKKCTEKIKGINVKTTSQVNEKALSFLSGNTIDVISPTRAIPSANLPTGTEIEYDDHYHYLVPYEGNSFIFEHAKNRSGTPSLKKTPTLRGYVEGEEADEDNYKEMMKEKIPEDIFNKLAKKKNFKFEGKVIKKPKEEPIVPQLQNREEEEEEEEPNNDSDVDEILAELAQFDTE